MVCLWTLIWRWLISWATTFAVGGIVQVPIGLHWPPIGLSRAMGVLVSLLGVLGGGFRSALALADAVYFPSDALLLGSAFCVDSSGKAVGALVYVGDVLGRLVVTHDVLPRIALLAQDCVAVVI